MILPCPLQIVLTLPRPRQDGHAATTRSRRTIAETGSFGKSTRRSRSRTATPARSRENPTLAAADKVFGDWIANQASSPAAANSAKSAGKPAAQDDAAASAAPQRVMASASTPVEVILRGYRSSEQQYAAVAHYEALAGIILEDYPRDPPPTQRRWVSELRDPAYTRRRALTPEQRAMVNRAHGGEHWVKVTFESPECGDAAMYSSPQRILGHLVYAEQYRGMPPTKDEACPDVDLLVDDHGRSRSMPAGDFGTPSRRNGGRLPTSLSSRLLDLSPPPDSRTSSQTLETGTLSTSHVSSGTITDPNPRAGFGRSSASATGNRHDPIPPEDSLFCRRIPTARRARLLPAEQALLPQQSVMQRFVNAIPLVRWFGGSMIGNEVPRTEAGEFDWNRASLYWKVIWWLDSTFGLFKGDVYSIDKDE